MDLRRLRSGLRHLSRLPEVGTCVRSVSGGARLAASYAGLRGLVLPCRVSFRSGLTYRLEEYYDLETLWQIHFHRVYRLLDEDAVIVDAGANIGLFACWAALRNRQATILAVEPSPGNFNRLRAHVEQNGLLGRVRPIRAALGATGGEAWVSAVAEAGQMRRVSSAPAVDAASVPLISLDDLLRQVPSGRIDFLKMDIEGSEYPTLLAASIHAFNRIRRLTVEYHESPDGVSTKETLIDHLRASRFTRVVDRHPHARYGLIDACHA